MMIVINIRNIKNTFSIFVKKNNKYVDGIRIEEIEKLMIIF